MRVRWIAYFTAIEKAEKENSRLTYRFYDLWAQAYYQNHNKKTSLLYLEKYFANYPFKNHPVINQQKKTRTLYNDEVLLS